MKKESKLLLIVLDGWGVRNSQDGNAIDHHAEYFEKLKKENYYLELNASGKYVGLLKDYIGNSEVGHLHIGAGRLVKQDLARITEEINNGKFFKNKVLIQAMKKAGNSSLHLLGLVSDAGVHSHIQHLFALLKMAHLHKVKQVFIHAITDGRDVHPKTALKYLENIENELRKYNKDWKIATIMGRYYAMDRDNRWSREHKAYDAMVNLKGRKNNDVKTAVLEAYNKGESDEFIYPTIIGESYSGVKPKDVIVFFNFRSDRARELTKAFVQGRFNNFQRKKIMNLHFVCLTQYDEKIKTSVIYPPVYLKNTLGEIVSKHGLKQYRLAETEKWAHVTYFFNGLSGRIFNKEDRLLISSPRVRTYDRTPEMSAYKITENLINVLKEEKYGFILVNFANADMVGHTGDFKKTEQAIKVIDDCLKRLVPQAKNYNIIITADHGNAEIMKGRWITSHTTSKVPFILITSKEIKLTKTKDTSLYNIAPTILKLMNIKKPAEMCDGLIEFRRV